MTRSTILGMVLVGLGVVGFVIFAGWQIPAPVAPINKVIPSDNLPK